MFKRFKDWRIRAKINAGLFTMLLALALLVGADLYRNWTVAGRLDDFQGLVELGVAGSALVHELQKERGMSAGFIGSNGAKFGDLLPEQRALTDQKIAAFRSQEQATDILNADDALKAPLEKINEAFERLKIVRQRIDGLETTLGEAAGYYTQTIAHVMEVEYGLAQYSTDPELVKIVIAFDNLLEAKERMGLERAMGSNGFGAGRFELAIYQRFITLIAQQEAFFHEFRAYAQPAFIKQLDDVMASQAAQSVARYRQIALDSIDAGEPLAVDAEEPPAVDAEASLAVDAEAWFQAITEKIEHVKTLEDSLSGHLLETSEELSGQARSRMLLFAGLFLAVFAFVWLVSAGLGRTVSAPVRDMSDLMRRLAGGELDAEIPNLGRRDEIGGMARALQVFKENALEMARLREEEIRTREEAAAVQEQVRQEEEARRQALIQELASKFETRVGGIVQALAAAAQQLQDASQALTGTAAETNSQAAGAAASSEQASQSVQAVAESAEKISTAIKDIAGLVSQSTDASGQAVEEADATSADMEKLNESVHRIGEIIGLINQIAEQTNLLALNAAIEAASAGESGKGFAVVATEVKTLANRTSGAIEEVREFIEAVQGQTRHVASSLTGIRKTILGLKDKARDIADSVDNQNHATEEIAQNAFEASSGTREAVATVAAVTNAATQTGDLSAQVLEAAKSLATQSQNLDSAVAAFLADLRA